MKNASKFLWIVWNSVHVTVNAKLVRIAKVILVKNFAPMKLPILKSVWPFGVKKKPNACWIVTNQENHVTMHVTLRHARMNVTLHGSNVKSVAIVNVHAIASVQMVVHVSVTPTAVNLMSTVGTTVQTTIWTMTSLTVFKNTVMYQMNVSNYVVTPLTNALSTVPVMLHVSTDAKPMKKTANLSVHATKTVPKVAHAQDGAVNFHVTPSGLISEIAAKTSAWSSGTTARNHVVMDKILKSA